MTRQEFNAWATRYAATFGLASDADADMFGQWYALFSHLSYTRPDLDAAAVAVAADPPGQSYRWREEHLKRIHAAVKARRDAAALAESRTRAIDQRNAERTTRRDFRARLRLAAANGNQFAAGCLKRLTEKTPEATEPEPHGDAWEPPADAPQPAESIPF